MHTYLKQALLSAFLLLFLNSVVSCASYKAKQQNATSALPELGSIVKKRSTILYKSVEQVGIPHWSSPIKINVKEIPFSTASYTVYRNYAAKTGMLHSISYVDSLSVKPKYLQLTIQDKIALTTLLNAETNFSVKTYLEKDADYKIVTSVDATVTDALLAQILNADALLLTQDNFKNRQLVLVNGKKQQVLSNGQIQVFHYKMGSFCWGEDKYSKKRIQIITSDTEACPKGTYKKAAKIKVEKAYLKL